MNVNPVDFEQERGSKEEVYRQLVSTSRDGEGENIGREGAEQGEAEGSESIRKRRLREEELRGKGGKGKFD